MSFGNQLNIFAAQSSRYGQDWRGIVLCSNGNEMHHAVQSALDLLHGNYNRCTRRLTMPNGATLDFRVLISRGDCHAALSGREFTQIAWLHRPADEHIRAIARSRLRSKTVPSADLRYEYCMVQ